MDISNFVLTLGTTGPSSSQSSSHTPRRQNTIDSSSTKENALSGRKTPSGGPIMESPKVGNSGEQQLMKSYYCSKNSSRIISHFCNIWIQFLSVECGTSTCTYILFLLQTIMIFMNHLLICIITIWYIYMYMLIQIYCCMQIYCIVCIVFKEKWVFCFYK